MNYKKILFCLIVLISKQAIGCNREPSTKTNTVAVRNFKDARQRFCVDAALMLGFTFWAQHSFFKVQDYFDKLAFVSRENVKHAKCYGLWAYSFGVGVYGMYALVSKLDEDWDDLVYSTSPENSSILKLGMNGK